jgi:hypothetical protein
MMMAAMMALVLISMISSLQKRRNIQHNDTLNSVEQHSITNKNANLSVMTLTIMALCMMPLRISIKN